MFVLTLLVVRSLCSLVLQCDPLCFLRRRDGRSALVRHGAILMRISMLAGSIELTKELDLLDSFLRVRKNVQALLEAACTPSRASTSLHQPPPTSPAVSRALQIELLTISGDELRVLHLPE